MMKLISQCLVMAAVLVGFDVNAQTNEIVFGVNDRTYFGEKLPVRATMFESDSEAQDVVQKIMSALGLIPKFEIRVGGVGNAAAVIQNGKRLIIYDQFFIRNLTQKTGTKWAAISVMAHEIGHHLNGDTLDGSGSRPKIELEADTFSGAVLQKMGASLDEARKGMELLGSESASSTHPAKHDRLAAITRGWIDSCNKDPGCGGVARMPTTSSQSRKVTEQCPSGQVLRADSQGGLARGEGYCVKLGNCVNGIDIDETNRMISKGVTNPDGSAVRVACLR